MSRKRKIVLVIPTLHAGGMERVMCELATYFYYNTEIEVHLVLYGLNRELFYALPPKLEVHQLQIPNGKRYFRIISTIKAALFLRKRIVSLKPDAVLSFGEHWNNFVLLSLLGKNLKIFVSDRCEPYKRLGFIQQLLRNWLYKKTSGIIAQTENAKQVYLKNFPKQNIRVINNPIRKILNEKGIRRENIVLTVGRLIKSKHHDQLIKIFCKINLPNWKLIIVGNDVKDQNNMQKLQNLVKELHADDKVILKGSQQNVDEYYTKSSIFAFTSSSEGFPNVIGEAQMAGLPVISFDCSCGPSEMVIDNENGFLIPVFDYLLFQQKLELLMKSKELRESFGNRAIETVKAFAVERKCVEFENFLLG